MPEEYDGPERPDDLNDPPAFFPLEGVLGDETQEVELVDVQVEGVFQADAGDHPSYFVVLRDEFRKLPINIGPFEAQAIQLVIEGTRPDRPITHDLLKTLLERLDGSLDRVVIDDFWNGIYYAKLFIKKGKEELEVDSRPSDAIALAVRCDVPIYVSEALLSATLEE